MNKVEFEEIKEIKEKNPKADYSGYWIRCDQTGLGAVEIMPENYAFWWDGKIEFSDLDKEVLGTLPKYLYPESEHWNPRLNTKVSLVYKNKLMEYDLNKQYDNRKYIKALQNPRSMLSILYDVGLYNDKLQPKYAFTAENYKRPDFSKDEENELAISLPRYRLFTRDFLNWVIDHHTEAAILRENLDQEDFLSKFNNLIKP